MPRGRHNVLRCQARKIVYDVLTYMKKEADDGLQHDLNCALKRTAAATRVSEKTVKRIATPSNDSSSDLLEAFSKKKAKKTVSGLDNFTKGVIKRIIHKFHLTEGVLPTIGQLLRKLKTEIKYEGSASNMRRILKELGFKWKKTVNDKKILIESSNIRLKRIEYLRKIANYRAEGKSIIYTDEMYIALSNTGDSSTNGVVILHAGCEAGFVPNALLICKADMKPGHYDNSMDYENYEKWVRTHLIPNISPNSVVVMDNAPYHIKVEDVPPNSYSRKTEMLSWLSERNIPCNSNMFKPELFKLICIHKEKVKKFNIDRILKENNHKILHLPPYHPDLNPMEMVWEEITEIVAKTKNLSSITSVMKLVKNKAKTMGENEWRGFCEKIVCIEDEYDKNDIIIDDLTDHFTLNESENESEKEEATSDTSEDDSSTEEEPSLSNI